MHGTKNISPTLINSCLLIVLFWGIYQAQPFLIPLCIASLVALTMAPWVRLMRRFHFPEWLAISLSAVLLILPFLSTGYVLVWQGQSLIKDLPLLMNALNHMISRIIDTPFGQRLHLTHEFDIPEILRRLEGGAVQGLQFAISGLGALLGAGSQVVVVLFFGVLMLASRIHFRTSFDKILHHSFSLKDSKILDEAIVLIERFLISRLLIVIIVAGTDTAILKAFNIRYSILLGSFLGIMTLVPAIGFLIGVALPLILALASGFSFLQTLGLFLALFGISIIEGNVLTPSMVGKRLNINTLSTFIGLFAGGLFWGIWGMFLSIPILGILRILLATSPSLHPWSELLADKSEKFVLPLRQKSKKRVV